MRALASRTLLAAAVLAAAGCAPSLTERYSDYVSQKRAEGFLRTDVNPTDAPFDAETLSTNFTEVAFFTEFAKDTAEEARNATAMSRWEQPIRYVFGGEGITSFEAATLLALKRRLRVASGLSITEFIEGRGEEPNLFIFLVGDQERELLLEKLAEEQSEERIALPRRWHREARFPCVGQFYRGGESGAEILGGLVLIKAELDPQMRAACLHEEITQILGLLNDGDDVRPSIFNDDQEFARLTRHDEMLVRMLYDPRLRPGMTLKDAQPLLPEIARDAYSGTPL